GYAFAGDRAPGAGALHDRRVGFKTVIYGAVSGGAPAVVVELYADWNDDWNDDGTWQQLNRIVDDGGIGDDGGVCGGAPDQLLTWGGPIVTFRWDTATDVDVDSLSVREIAAADRTAR